MQIRISFALMLKVHIPDPQNSNKFIDVEYPDSAESYVREYMINPYPPEVQINCRIDVISTTANAPIEIIEPPKAQPKTKARLAMEIKAEELGIRGIDLYTDDRLKERIEQKSAKLIPTTEIKPLPKKRGRPKQIKNA